MPLEVKILKNQGVARVVFTPDAPGENLILPSTLPRDTARVPWLLDSFPTSKPIASPQARL